MIGRPATRRRPGSVQGARHKIAARPAFCKAIRDVGHNLDFFCKDAPVTAVQGIHVTSDKTMEHPPRTPPLALTPHTWPARARRLGLAIVLGLIVIATPMAGARAAKSEPVDEDAFMVMAPLQVAIVQSGRPRGVLLVDIGLEIPDSDLRARVRSGLPRLRDHMLRSLSLFAANAVDFNRPVDVVRLAGRLQTVADAYADEKAIKVLLVNVTLQRQ